MKNMLRYVSNTVRWTNDLRLVHKQYKKKFGHLPNLILPKTFNEKICYRKVFDRRGIYNILSDKIEVKKLIKDKIGEGYTPNTLYVYESPSDFKEEHVREKCMIKCSDGWHDHMVLEPNRFDPEEVRSYIHEWINKDQFWRTREWGYYGVQSRVFIEEFIEPEIDMEVPVDYKYYCFGGKTGMVEIISGRAMGDMRSMYTDPGGNPIDLVYCSYSEKDELPIPVSVFMEMREVAEKIAGEFDFIRVDMYYVRGSPLIGELTVYPSAGLKHLKPHYWDEHLGSLWKEHRSLATWLRSMVADTWPVTQR